METRDGLLDTMQHRAAFHPMYLLKALRPRQWMKNFLVFLPFVFAVKVAWDVDRLEPVPEIVFRLFLIFVAFCALSSSTYLLNDLMDRKSDRLHPHKRNRPIASGQVAPLTALVTLIFLAIGGVAIAAAVDLVLGGIGLIYLGISLGYSLGIKRIVLIDVLAVSSGYVIRAIAGAVAIDATPSPWLYTTTTAGALFIVLGRRYAEVRLAGDGAANQRSVLHHYAGPFIGQLLTIAATSALTAYVLYTVEAANLPKNNTMLLTVPFVTFGLFRYLYLLNNSKEAETPEQLISQDIPLMVAIFGWMAVASLVLLLNS